jgi:hypothetical protein
MLPICIVKLCCMSVLARKMAVRTWSYRFIILDLDYFRLNLPDDTCSFLLTWEMRMGSTYAANMYSLALLYVGPGKENGSSYLVLPFYFSRFGLFSAESS